MKTLLIVDDEWLVAEGLKSVLAEAFENELQVLCCYSAESALQIAEKTDIDILITDINMPDCTGLELHERLRKRHPDCRVIYLTGYSEFEYARQALDQQAFAYILKGEGDELVIRTIQRVLGTDTPQPQPEPQQSVAETSPDWLAQLHTYIYAHLADDLSLNRLAEICHFHPVYLSRAYKDAVGMNLSDAIGKIKQERAEQLLQSSDCSIQEIARRTGFATDNYFCRWFRKRLGMTPYAYRAMQQKKGGRRSGHE